MQYVMIVEVPEESLDGDDSIESAARAVNEAFDVAEVPFNVRPLSEVIAS